MMLIRLHPTPDQHLGEVFSPLSALLVCPKVKIPGESREVGLGQAQSMGWQHQAWDLGPLLP